jgi:hypothetical protein
VACHSRESFGSRIKFGNYRLVLLGQADLPNNIPVRDPVLELAGMKVRPAPPRSARSILDRLRYRP